MFVDEAIVLSDSLAAVSDKKRVCENYAPQRARNKGALRRTGACLENEKKENLRETLSVDNEKIGSV